MRFLLEGSTLAYLCFLKEKFLASRQKGGKGRGNEDLWTFKENTSFTQFSWVIPRYVALREFIVILGLNDRGFCHEKFENQQWHLFVIYLKVL